MRTRGISSKPHSKTGLGRLVDLDPYTLEDLRLWREVRGGEGRAWLLPDRDGNVTTRTHSNWRNMYRAAAERVAQTHPKWRRDLLRCRVYDLWHTTVSLCVRSGLDTAQIARRHGHTTKTMLDRYTQVIDALAGMPVLPVAEQIAAARKATGSTEATRALQAALMRDVEPPAPLIDLAAQRARRRASQFTRARDRGRGSLGGASRR